MIDYKGWITASYIVLFPRGRVYSRNKVGDCLVSVKDNRSSVRLVGQDALFKNRPCQIKRITRHTIWIEERK